MAISFVQISTAVTGSALSVAVTLSSTTSAGSIVVCAGSCNRTGTTPSLANDKGDIVTDSGPGFVDDGTNAKSFVKAFFNPTVGSKVYTLTFGATTFGDLYVYEIAGLTNAQFDKVVQQNSVAAATSGSTGTLSSANEAAIGYGETGGAFSAPGVSPWVTGQGSTVGTNVGDGINGNGSLGEHQVLSATTAIAATGTAGGANHIWCATVMSGAGPGAAGPGIYLLEDGSGGYELEDSSGRLQLEDDTSWFSLLPDALDDTSEEGVFDEALWQADNAPITPPVIPDLIESFLSEDDFVPEEGLELTQANLTEDAPIAADNEQITALGAEDDFVPEEGLDLSQPGVTDQLLAPEIGWQDAEDDFVPEEGLDLVQPGSPDQFLAPEISWLDAEDDFVSEEGLDLVQPGLIDATLNLVTDGIVALNAEDDFIEEGGLDLSLSGPTDDIAVATTDVLEYSLSFFDLLDAVGESSSQSNLTENPPGQLDVLEYSLSFYDLTDLVTESLSQSHLTEDPLPGFDGALIDLLFDNEQNILTDFAQSNLIETAPPTADLLEYNLSFFDLLDLVTESFSQSHLTEAAPPTSFGPDIVNVEAQDDFEPETGLDLVQATPTDAAAATSDVLQYNLSFFDLADLVAESLSQPHLTEDSLVALSGLLMEAVFDAEQRIDTSLAQSNPTEPPPPSQPEVGALDAEDDFVGEDGLDLSLAFPPDDAPVVPLAPEINWLDADDDFVEETGLDLTLDLPPDVPPPPVRLRGAGYFKRPYKEIFRAIEKLAPWVPNDPVIARAVDTARDAVSLVAGTTADSDAPAGGLLQLHRTPPDLSAMTRALGAAARASTLANKVRHARLASMHAQAVLQRLKQAEEDEDEEDALCLLIY